MSIETTEQINSLPHYCIAGYGRIGKKVAQMLLRNGNKVTVFDQNLDELDIQHENLIFKKIAGHTKEELEEVGLPNITGLIITTGIFSINTSIFVLAERYFPRSEYKYQLIIRAIVSEEKDLFVKFESMSEKEEFAEIVYSEEAGARTIASTILEMSKESQYKGKTIYELNTIINGDGSDFLIKLTSFYAKHKLDIFNEFLQNGPGESYYYTIISGLNNDSIQKLDAQLKTISNINYFLRPREMKITEEIIEESKTIMMIKQAVLKGGSKI